MRLGALGAAVVMMLAGAIAGAQRVEVTVAETDWRLSPERVVRGMSFNGQFPGQVIEARQNHPLELVFRNNLPEATVVHWHGLRVPAAMDGTEMSQKPIQPGAMYTYTFTPPDAGTFWYHPHLNESRQIERGLYGVVIVRADSEPVFDGEKLLVLDDIKLDKKGIAPFGTWAQRWNGREGDVRLINGQEMPDLSIAAGHIERWRVLNASNARYIRLSLGGIPFRLIATDGGFVEAPVSMTEVLLTPGDRVELAVGPFNEGQTIAIESLPYERGAEKPRTEHFGAVRTGTRRESVARVPEQLRSITPIADATAVPTRTITLGEKLSVTRAVNFLINGKMNPHDAPVTVGSLQVWDVVNKSRLDHPFHLHGFFFQVLSIDGKAPAYRTWEDVVNVPKGSTVRIAWRADDRPGPWMYHCHIVEHQGAGMMAHFEVVRAP